jgi:hypothetical protein
MPTIKYSHQDRVVNILFRLEQTSTLGLLIVQVGLWKKTHQFPVTAGHSTPLSVLRSYSKDQFCKLLGPNALEFSVEETRARLARVLQGPQSAGVPYIYAPLPGSISQRDMHDLHREHELAQFDDSAEFVAWFVQSRFVQVFCRQSEFELAAEALAVFTPSPLLDEIWRHWRLFLAPASQVSAPA